MELQYLEGINRRRSVGAISTSSYKDGVKKVITDIFNEMKTLRTNTFNTMQQQLTAETIKRPELSWSGYDKIAMYSSPFILTYERLLSQWSSITFPTNAHVDALITYLNSLKTTKDYQGFDAGITFDQVFKNAGLGKIDWNNVVDWLNKAVKYVVENWDSLKQLVQSSSEQYRARTAIQSSFNTMDSNIQDNTKAKIQAAILEYQTSGNADAGKSLNPSSSNQAGFSSFLGWGIGLAALAMLIGAARGAKNLPTESLKPKRTVSGTHKKSSKKAKVSHALSGARELSYSLIH